MTLLPCSLHVMSDVRCNNGGVAGDVLAKLLDLLDLTGQLGGEGLLQGLQLTLLAMNPDSRILLSARIQWSWRSRRVRQ